MIIPPQNKLTTKHQTTHPVFWNNRYALHHRRIIFSIKKHSSNNHSSVQKWAPPSKLKSVRLQANGSLYILSGQIIIFHQPRFPWNKGISLTKLPFKVRSCEVAIIWVDIIHWTSRNPCSSNGWLQENVALTIVTTVNFSTLPSRRLYCRGVSAASVYWSWWGFSGAVSKRNQYGTKSIHYDLCCPPSQDSSGKWVGLGWDPRS